jgi:heat shock protein 5
MILWPEEIAAKLIGKLRDDAEKFLGRKVTHAVATVPAHFTDTQRQALKDAGIIAGLNILRVMNEPSAAGVAHGLDRSEVEKVLLFYDLGSSSTQAMVLEIDRGVFEVLSNINHSHLGAADLEDVLFNYIANIYAQQTRKILTKKTLKLIHTAVQKAEATLLIKPSAKVQMTTFPIPDGFSEPITRMQVQDLQRAVMVEDFLRLINVALDDVPDDMKPTHNQVDFVILTGSPAHTALVRPFFEGIFGARKVLSDIPSNEAVVRGAAIQGYVLSRDEATSDCPPMLDATGLSLGIETADGLATKLIHRNTVMPTRKSNNFTTIANGQRKVVLKIVEGERPLAGLNEILGTLTLNLDPQPKHAARIEVVFEVDPDGELMVIAREVDGFGKARLVVRLIESWEEKDKRFQENEKFYEEDQKVVNMIKGRGGKIEDDGSFGVMVAPKYKEKELRQNDGE